MKELPDKLQLDIMWTVATSSSIETGTRPQYGFAQMLYDYLVDKKPRVTLGDDKLLHFIQYNEKFDVYSMREYFQDTPVTRGIMQYLQDMKDGKPNPSRTVYHEQFISTLGNLCWWWD